MPSGFQQDPNQLQPAYFRVVLDMTNQYNYWTNNNHPAATGGVQPYAWDNFTGNDQPATVIAGKTLARGNLRFQRIIEELTRYADAQIVDVEALSGTDPVTGNKLANHLAFTVRYDRFGIDTNEPDLSNPQNHGEWASALLQMEVKYLRAANNISINDNANSPFDGQHINLTIEAIQEAIMRALILPATRSVRVFVPQEGSNPIVGEGTQKSVTINDVTYNQNTNSWSDLRSTITVVAMDGTTLITSDDDAL
jgi:hypothetical protein